MKTKGRNVSIALGVVSAVLIMICISQWHVLYIRYIYWRLDEAETWEKATSCMEALTAEALRLNDPNLLVDRLGPVNQRYTFWFFTALQHNPSYIAMRPKNDEPFQSLQTRLKNNSELISMWIQFLHWRHDHYVLKMIMEPIDVALARVELARIQVMPDGDEKRLAYTRWVVNNLEEIDRYGIKFPKLPFPEWSGPIFTVPYNR